MSRSVSSVGDDRPDNTLGDHRPDESILEHGLPTPPDEEAIQQQRVQDGFIHPGFVGPLPAPGQPPSSATSGWRRWAPIRRSASDLSDEANAGSDDERIAQTSLSGGDETWQSVGADLAGEEELPDATEAVFASGEPNTMRKHRQGQSQQIHLVSPPDSPRQTDLTAHEREGGYVSIDPRLRTSPDVDRDDGYILVSGNGR